MSLQNSFIVRRIVTTSGMPSKLKIRIDFATYCLEQACQHVAQGAKVFQTPGGFLFDEQDLKKFNAGEQSSVSEFIEIFKKSQIVIKQLLTKNVIKLLVKNTHFVTLCLDVFDPDGDKHVELIGTFNTKEGRFAQWTGKSYPVRSQSKTLLYCMDLKTHFQYFDRTPVLILGCHDLNIFSPRSRALVSKDSYKGRLISDMQRLSDKFKPQVVLQHPHYTDSSKIWSTAWAGVRRFIPTVQAFSSGIHYENKDGGRPRQSLERVLKGTSMGNIQSVIVKTTKGKI